MPIYKSDGKKDGKQKYRVRINYQDSYGNNKQITRIAYGADSAKQLELELMQSVSHNNVSDLSTKITLNQLEAEYIKVKTGEVRKTTAQKNHDILTQHVLAFFNGVNSKMPIDKLDMPALQSWKIYIKSKNLSLKTNQNIYSTFRALLNYAVSMDYLSKNPLLKVGNFKDSSTVKREMQYYTEEEFAKYIKTAKSAAEASELAGRYTDWCFYTFFMIAFFTGARKGEINALQWSDISDDGYMSINRSVAQKLKGDDIFTPPKNKSSIRTLQMPSQLVTALQEQKRRQQERIKCFSDDLLVCGGDKPLRDTSLDKRNREFAELAGVKRIRIHDFRHSHVSLLANSGINIQEVARRLGHARVEMTWNTYSHLYPKEEERAMAVLNNIKI